MSRRRTLHSLLALLTLPTPAAAHLVSTGMGPVYDGIGHLLLTPEDGLAALALSFYAGLRGGAASRKTMFLLPAAWLVGSLLPSFSAPAALAASLLVTGGLVAADLRLPDRGIAALVIAMGLLHGCVGGASVRQEAGILGLIGMTGALFVLTALASALVVSLTRPWTRIAVRVVGSWIAASGLLMLGWCLR